MVHIKDMETNFDFARFEKLLDRGLCKGLERDGLVCVEAAVALCSGEVLNDRPSCVLAAANVVATTLNDATWSSPQARAKGLRRFALAHIGTRDLNDKEFSARLAEQTIRQIVPIALRAAGLEEAAARCATEGTKEAAWAAEESAKAAAVAARAAEASSDWAVGEAADRAAAAAWAARAAARAAVAGGAAGAGAVGEAPRAAGAAAAWAAAAGEAAARAAAEESARAAAVAARAAGDAYAGWEAVDRAAAAAWAACAAAGAAVAGRAAVRAVAVGEAPRAARAARASGAVYVGEAADAIFERAADVAAEILEDMKAAKNS